MADKAILQIDVQADAFTAFQQQFQRFTEMLEDLPNTWQKSIKAMDDMVSKMAPLTAAFDGLGRALGKLDQTSGRLEKITAQTGRMADQVHTVDDTMRSATTFMGQFSRHVADVNRGVGNWPSLIGMLKTGAGYLGIGVSVAGMEQLMRNMIETQRQAAGMGMTWGQYRQLQVAGTGVLAAPGATAENLARARYDITSPQRRAFQIMFGGSAGAELRKGGEAVFDFYDAMERRLAGVAEESRGTLYRARGGEAVGGFGEYMAYISKSAEERQKIHEEARKTPAEIDKAAAERITGLQRALGDLTNAIEPKLLGAIDGLTQAMGLQQQLEGLAKGDPKAIVQTGLEAIVGWKALGMAKRAIFGGGRALATAAEGAAQGVAEGAGTVLRTGIGGSALGIGLDIGDAIKEMTGELSGLVQTLRHGPGTAPLPSSEEGAGAAAANRQKERWWRGLQKPAPGGGIWNLPGLQEGGIVTRPTTALVGEAGPEAILPLTGYFVGGQKQTQATDENTKQMENLTQALRAWLVMLPELMKQTMGGGGGGGGGSTPRGKGGGGGTPDTGSGGGTPGADEGKMPKGSERERAMAFMNKLIAKGWSLEKAAIAAGNVQQESNFNPAGRPGDKGTAHGLAQWRLDRFEALKAYAAKQGKPWTDADVQTDFFDYEARKRGMATTGGMEGAGAWGHRFEGYGDRSEGTRVGNAQRLLQEWKRTHGQGGVAPAQKAPGPQASADDEKHWRRQMLAALTPNPAAPSVYAGSDRQKDVIIRNAPGANIIMTTAGMGSATA
jgi:hypothetical protein